jgi:hypothetical protein
VFVLVTMADAEGFEPSVPCGTFAFSSARRTRAAGRRATGGQPDDQRAATEVARNSGHPRRSVSDEVSSPCPCPDHIWKAIVAGPRSASIDLSADVFQGSNPRPATAARLTLTSSYAVKVDLS